MAAVCPRGPGDPGWWCAIQQGFAPGEGVGPAEVAGQGGGRVDDVGQSPVAAGPHGGGPRAAWS